MSAERRRILPDPAQTAEEYLQRKSMIDKKAQVPALLDKVGRLDEVTGTAQKLQTQGETELVTFVLQPADSNGPKFSLILNNNIIQKFKNDREKTFDHVFDLDGDAATFFLQDEINRNGISKEDLADPYKDEH